MSDQGTDRPPTSHGDSGPAQPGLPRRERQAWPTRAPLTPAPPGAPAAPEPAPVTPASGEGGAWAASWAAQQPLSAADQVPWTPISRVPSGDDWPPAVLGSDPLAPDMFASAPVPAQAQVRSRTARKQVEQRPARRRRWQLWSLPIGLLAVGGGVAAVLVWGGPGEERSPAPAIVTITAAEPTPSTSPVDRGAGTDLFTALPGTVRQYVLTEIAPFGLTGAYTTATEAYLLTYAGTTVDGVPTTIQVTVSQWATPEDATAAAVPVLAAAGTPTSTGEVTADGIVTGAFALFGEPDTENATAATATQSTPAAEPATTASPAATGSAIWTNGTLLIQVQGPGTEIANLYRAFSF